MEGTKKANTIISQNDNMASTQWTGNSSQAKLEILITVSYFKKILTVICLVSLLCLSKPYINFN